MSQNQDDVKPLRPWREIAGQAAEQSDPDKTLDLAQELIRALDAESNKRMGQIRPEEKEKGAA